ncbi:hypothetical protein BCR39DRAFT_505536 [Naematelia encephala]|uniref:Uncharacterized protein n=1 Tax=Naematelia encephala TaxID=71784 RepID=A0A1Y2B423_9TREE|nr:hypothetical protein BCR39DRAFT_505536 [Naematelia encephala]
MSEARIPEYEQDGLGSYPDRPGGQEETISPDTASAVETERPEAPGTTSPTERSVTRGPNGISPPSLSFTVALPTSADIRDPPETVLGTTTGTNPSFGLDADRWRSCLSLLTIDSHDASVRSIATIFGTVTGTLGAAAFNMEPPALAAGAGIGGALLYGISSFFTKRSGSHYDPEQGLSESGGPRQIISVSAQSQSGSVYPPPPWMMA